MCDEQPILVRTSCPHRILLDQIADKWSVLILAILCQQPRRFNVLKRELEGITQKALTQSLRKLQRNGIIERHVLDTSPIAVEYEITPLGRTLKVPFEALFNWTQDNLPAVERARQDYDSKLES